MFGKVAPIPIGGGWPLSSGMPLRRLPQPFLLTTSSERRLDRLALPVGGIGTGTISVGGRGRLRDWEIVNHTSKGFSPKRVFFAVAAGARSGGLGEVRLLEGALPEAEYEGESGSPTPLAGVPRFAQAVCRTSYPFIEVKLSDRSSPIEAALLAYNPFIPGDVAGSSWPVAVFELTLTNRTPSSLEVAALLACENFIGSDGIDTESCTRGSRARRGGGLRGVHFSAEGLAPDSELQGDFCIAAEEAGSSQTATSLPAAQWNNDLRRLLESLASARRLPPETGGSPLGQVKVQGTIPPRGTRTFRFFIAWRFANRLAWSCDPGEKRPVIGNHYAGLGATSWEILKKFRTVLPGLREKTVRFVDAFAKSDLPVLLKEAALANLPPLRSQTLFRTPDGKFFAYEGGHRNKRIAGTIGSCTHVWGYDMATSFLFPEIARAFRELHFGPSQYPDGAIAFRTGLPLSRALRYGKVAADGQLASVIGFYRDFLLAGDAGWGRRLWPRVRQALRFCWQKGAWDEDGDGVMEGCQHNTMDIDYFGPNPQIQGLYVTALRCGAELGRHFGDAEFATRCGRLAAAGARFLDEQLFNGEYFVQRVPDSWREMRADPRLRFSEPGNGREPAYQLGPGALIDQMIGGLHAQVCGLPEPAGKLRVRKALAAVARHNFRPRFDTLLNHMRSYALNGEAGTVMASWPRGGRPEIPFPYFTEVMAGFEHVLAAHLFYHEKPAAGRRILSAIRRRHDGSQRNPFNEAEWGNHYGRSLAAWTSIWAWTGQHYHAGRGVLSFRGLPRKGCWPWFSGEGWGTIRLESRKRAPAARIEVCHGALRLSALRIAGHSYPMRARSFRANQTLFVPIRDRRRTGD